MVMLPLGATALRGGLNIRSHMCRYAMYNDMPKADIVIPTRAHYLNEQHSVWFGATADPHTVVALS